MKCFNLSEINIFQDIISQGGSIFRDRGVDDHLLNSYIKKYKKYSIFHIPQSYCQSELKIFIFSFFFMSIGLWQICSPEEFT